MSRADAILSWLEDRSDWLSPIIVKEVRQVVRGKEFNYSFGASLVAGLAVAFFGAADALTGAGTSGQWTFIALMGCLAVLGLAVVPLSAFSALRNERMDQTLELITLTALSPRRVVVGKLLSQAVKLATLFAAIAPFIAMSFLLGGIDFVTITVSLFVLFMWSVWACALCLFLSTLFKSRAMSGLVFGGVGIALFVVFVMGRALFFMARFGRGAGGLSATTLSVSSGSESWWALAMMVSFCLASMVNLVLLAENRLTLATENRVTTLRIGFLVQFLLIVGWALSFINHPTVRSGHVEALAVFGGLHLALVAMFTVTEDLSLPRRARWRTKAPGAWQWLLPIVLPGGGRGAAYVLVQMLVMLVAAWILGATAAQLRWLLAICGYICFFTGVSTFTFRFLRERVRALHLRVAVLVLLPMSLLLPDLIYYVFWRPEVLSLNYSARHLLNPLRTLANWHTIEAQGWFFVPVILGVTGLSTYVGLIHMGMLTTVGPAAVDPERPAPAAGEPGSANVTY
jgi:hypothetical protein